MYLTRVKNNFLHLFVICIIEKNFWEEFFILSKNQGGGQKHICQSRFILIYFLDNLSFYLVNQSLFV